MLSVVVEFELNWKRSLSAIPIQVRKPKNRITCNFGNIGLNTKIWSCHAQAALSYNSVTLNPNKALFSKSAVGRRNRW